MHAGKHENLIQIDTVILMGWSSIFKVTKLATLRCLYNMSRMELEMKLIFCMQINIKVAYKLISTLWAPRFPKRWYYHYWWAWWKIPKVLKVCKPLQYLKKEVRNGVHFLHADKHQSFLKVAIIAFDGNGRNVQSIWNRKLVIFLQYIKWELSFRPWL